MRKTPEKPVRRSDRFPAVPFIAAVAAVSLALAASALYSYSTLMRIRSDYLEHRGREIASAVDRLARGPGIRNNPAEWQRIFDQNLEYAGSSLSFLALKDGSGKILAGAGRTGSSGAYDAAEGFSETGNASLYVVEFPVMTGRQGPRFGSMMAEAAGWRVRVGLDAGAADFIRRAALVQLLMTGVAVAVVLSLALYLLHVLRRFVALKEREQSERRLKALGTMSASLAHEIRNPLGAIKGLTQLAQEEIPDQQAIQGIMKTVVSEAERLERLVTDLLEFARPRQIELKKADFASILTNVKGMLEPRLQQEGKTLRIVSEADSHPIRSDEGGLRQVLLNVVLNAIDFTPAGGTVTVRVRADKETGTLIAEIADQGPGPGTRDPQELFEPFVTTKVKGTGLGLAISRQIIDSLGGTIALEPVPEGGTRCVLRIPMNL
jgi:two-component system sensor histidine kinase HydH